MAKRMALTADVVKIVAKVTGMQTRFLFNDKRKSFERRYKLSGVRGVSGKQLLKIQKKLTKRYPDKQFVVQDAPKVRGGYPHTFTGLTVKVF
jgi:hypothetical protein